MYRNHSCGVGVKLKSLNREYNCRYLSLNTKKPALLQDKLFHANYSRVLDDRLTVLEMVVDQLLTDITLNLAQIQV